MLKQLFFRYRARDVSILLLFWVFVTFLFTIRGVLSSQIYSFLSFIKFFFYEFLCISPWVVGILLIAKIFKRSSLEDGPKYFFLHIILALFIFLFHSTVQTFINYVYYDLPFNYEYLKNDFLYFLDIRSLLYLGILIAVGYKNYYRKRGELTIRKQKLKTKLERTRLSAMINGIQPDFLIKNINEVSQLINKNAEKAEELLVCFSDLIRLLVRYTQKVDLTIADDITPYQIYTKYLSIKLNSSISFVADLEEDVKLKTIPKSFLVIPLLDRILEYNHQENKPLDAITYCVVDNGDSLNLNLKLSGLCSISEKQLKNIYQIFTHDMGNQKLNSDDMLITSLSKEEDATMLQVELKQSSMNE